MKIISIRQPWAYLIVTGQKIIENRSRRTHYRGPILIHASKAMSKTPLEEITRRYSVEIPQYVRNGSQCGGIVGACSIVDCVDNHESKWFDGEGFGYVLANARTLPWYPMNGQLGIFDVPDKLVQRVYERHAIKLLAA